MLLNDLQKKKLINPPKFVIDNTSMLVSMGSVAYGVSGDMSDVDIYGFCIPPKDYIFPYLGGYIPGFSTNIPAFEQYQQHHVKDGEKEYDFSIYSIVKYFSLLMGNNPNILDSLYVPVRCILHSTNIGNMVRENRKLFLHKGCFHKFRGYAYSSLYKMDNREHKGFDELIIYEKEHNIPNTMSFDDVKSEMAKTNLLNHLTDEELKEYYNLYTEMNKYSSRAEQAKITKGDWKFAYHVVRLIFEVEQILATGDLDLECNSEILKSIRRGEWTVEQIKDFFNSKEKALEELYSTSTLPYGPDENKIRKLLIDCLEEHYGDLNSILYVPDYYETAFREIQNVVEKYRK